MKRFLETGKMWPKNLIDILIGKNESVHCFRESTKGPNPIGCTEETVCYVARTLYTPGIHRAEKSYSVTWVVKSLPTSEFQGRFGKNSKIIHQSRLPCRPHIPR